MRIKFQKGKQKRFLNLVINKLNCVSLRGILQFGFNNSYDSLKNYYTERRLLPEDFFNDLCHISNLNLKDFNIKYFDDNWGKVKGGKIKKKRKGV